jgi:hypothetical protein
MNVEAVDTDFYQAQLDSILRLADSAPSVARREVAHIIELLLLETSRRLDFEEIERELVAATEIDVLVLKEAMAILHKCPLRQVSINAQRSIVPEEEFQRLEQALASLQGQQVLHHLEAMLRLEILINNPLMDLLICAAAADADVSPLIQIGATKLAHIREDYLVELWARVQSEFDPDRVMPSFDATSKILPPRFLELSEGAALRQKIAEYAIKIKPALVVERIAAGLQTYPVDALGPGRLLAINNKSMPIERDPLRLDLARAVSRLSAAWSGLLGRDIRELSGLTGVRAKTRLLSGPDVMDAKEEFAGALKSSAGESTAAAIAVYYAKRFLASVERLTGSSSTIADALRCHKLGLEVTIPDSARRFKGKSELTLQKELCKFLLEQGHYSEGTKFGPFETDLVATSRAVATVVEVKLYTKERSPSERTVRANLSQLQDYMDKRPVRPRGALVLYNMSDTLVVAPNRWIRGRFWITAVNLGLATGSRRQSTLTLEEALAGDELLVGYRNDSKTRAKKP